jgi:cell division protein FtsI/penicillin-binding protein 2
MVEMDRASNELPYTEVVAVQPVEGKDLTLTIDGRIQELAERVAKSDGSIKVGNRILYNDNKEDNGVQTFSDIIFILSSYYNAKLSL